jgi:hypothetical protein
VSLPVVGLEEGEIGTNTIHVDTFMEKIGYETCGRESEPIT